MIWNWGMGEYSVGKIFCKPFSFVCILEVDLINIGAILEPQKPMDMPRPTMLPFVTIPMVYVFEFGELSDLAEELFHSGLKKGRDEMGILCEIVDAPIVSCLFT